MSLSDSQVRALKASEKRQKKSCGSSSGLYVVVETTPLPQIHKAEGGDKAVMEVPSDAGMETA